MTLLPLARAYAQLLESIPKEPFPIKDSPKILSSIEERISSLKVAIKAFQAISKTLVDREITFIEKDSPFSPLVSKYLRAEASLPKEAILKNLEEATPFLRDSFIKPEFYQESLSLSDTSANQRLPSKTLEFFHAHACGQRMEQHESLGKGNYGVVFKKTLNEVPFACKTNELSRKEFHNCQVFDRTKEACAYSLLEHPYILRSLAFTLSPCELYLEYANGSLHDLLENQLNLKGKFRVLPSRLRWRFSIHIASALEYLHDKGFTHCDVKPTNILVDNDNFKLCDFGSAAYTKNNKEALTTPDHAAPESLKEDLLSEKLDVWAYATILYETFKPYIPYPMQPSDNNNWDIYKDRLYKERYCKPAELTAIFEETQRKEWDNHDPENIFRKLIEKCLHGNPIFRLSMKEVCKYLRSDPSALEVFSQEIRGALATL